MSPAAEPVHNCTNLPPAPAHTGNINYLGWKGKQDGDYDDDVNIVTVAFAWEDDDDDGGEAEKKPMSTILCGSTVEFEIALLTMSFLAGNQVTGSLS